jgi:hypothetical protein
MALDIAFGDLLVIGSDAYYPIKGIARWGATPASGMLALMNQTASTKRAPAIAGGKRGAAVTNLTNLVCTALLPLEGELAPRAGLQAPVQLFEVYVADTDADAVLRLTVEDVSTLN